MHGSTSRARSRHCLAEIFHRFVHACLQLYVSFFQARNRGHGGLRHISQLRGTLRIKTLHYKPNTNLPQISRIVTDQESINPCESVRSVAKCYALTLDPIFSPLITRRMLP